MIDAIGGRKLFAFMIGLAAGTLIEIYGKSGLSIQMAGLIATLVGTYCGANAIITSKFSGTDGAAGTSTPAGDPELLSGMSETLASINDAQLQSKAALDQVLQASANTQKILAVLLNSRGP